jgi:hypothetical protein
MTSMIGRLRHALVMARLLAETVSDSLRPVHRMPPALPATAARGPRQGRLRERTRAVSLFFRAVAALGIPWSCRRSAYAVYRALAREGAPARLCFGIRRARPGEAPGRTYVGHVWVRQDAEAPLDGFPLTVLCPAFSRAPAEPGASCPAERESDGWRRG